MLVCGLKLDSLQKLIWLPYLASACLTTSVRSWTLGSYAEAGVSHSIMSWPAPAANSAAVRAGRSAWLMWSTTTLTPFCSPHFFAHGSYHVS